jgi:hypothetical protein
MANTTGKKYGGRKKGTPNRLTKELRTLLKDVLYSELETIDERLELVIKLMPYAFPKVVSISHSANEPMDWGV